MELSNSIQAQFDAAKWECPVGWHWLVDQLARRVKDLSLGGLKLLDSRDKSWETPEKPFFDLTVSQIKQKMGEMRIHLFIDRVEHDWNKFDQDDYEQRFVRMNWEIHGMINMLGQISQEICEKSGERGKLRNIRGQIICLSDTEYAKVS